MPKVKIDREKCKGCMLCVMHCPAGCINMEKVFNKKGVYPAMFLDKDNKCKGCALCAVMCPDLCIEVYK